MAGEEAASAADAWEDKGADAGIADSAVALPGRRACDHADGTWAIAPTKINNASQRMRNPGQERRRRIAL